MERQLSFTTENSDGDVYYRFAVGKLIRRNDDGWYVLDGGWRTRLGVSSGAKTRIRDANGQQELVLPIANGMKAVQQFAW